LSLTVEEYTCHNLITPVISGATTPPSINIQGGEIGSMAALHTSQKGAWSGTNPSVDIDGCNHAMPRQRERLARKTRRG
jgi:hypothetical protein